MAGWYGGHASFHYLIEPVKNYQRTSAQVECITTSPVLEPNAGTIQKNPPPVRHREKASGVLLGISWQEGFR